MAVCDSTDTGGVTLHIGKDRRFIGVRFSSSAPGNSSSYDEFLYMRAISEAVITRDCLFLITGSSPVSLAIFQRGAMAAHLTVNQNVIGSSPVAGAKILSK